jgi:hypothetical protein
MALYMVSLDAAIGAFHQSGPVDVGSVRQHGIAGAVALTALKAGFRCTAHYRNDQFSVLTVYQYSTQRLTYEIS